MAASMVAKPFLGSSSTLSRKVAQPARAARVAPVAAAGIERPPQLDGSLPGDRGFDPLNLASDPERLAWFVEAEKTNGRWAMAAVAGILGQEILTNVAWYEAGAQPQPLPLNALTALEFLIIGHFELKRYQGWVKYGTSGVLDTFPFDPLGQNSNDMQVREVKNGRLAMVAFVGFAIQALVTREQPIAGLTAHLADPFGHNIITNVGSTAAFTGAN